jgi:hypothetical protein
LGLFHGVARTVLLVFAHDAFPGQRFVIIPAIIVGLYLISITWCSIDVTRPSPRCQRLFTFDDLAPASEAVDDSRHARGSGSARRAGITAGHDSVT